MKIVLNLTQAQIEAVRAAATDCMLEGGRMVRTGSMSHTIDDEDISLVEVWLEILRAAPPVRRAKRTRSRTK